MIQDDVSPPLRAASYDHLYHSRIIPLSDFTSMRHVSYLIIHRVSLVERTLKCEFFGRLRADLSFLRENVEAYRGLRMIDYDMIVQRRALEDRDKVILFRRSVSRRSRFGKIFAKIA